MHQQRFWHDACEHAWTLFSTSGGVCKLMALAAMLSLGVLARFTDIVPQLQFFGRVTTRFDILPKVDVSELQLCMQSTDSVNISVYTHERDTVVRAATVKCLRPHVGPGCVVTWSVNTLLSRFARQSSTWLEDDDAYLTHLRESIDVSGSTCARKNGVLQALQEAYNGLNVSELCRVNEEYVSTKRASSCAIVGGSPLLGQKPRYRDIDKKSHDLVFRYNTNALNEAHSGRRADVWIMNQMFAGKNMRKTMPRTGFNITNRTVFMQIAMSNRVVQRVRRRIDGVSREGCGGHALVPPRLIANACILSDGAISTGQLGLFIAASMCDRVDAYGFTPYNISNLFGSNYSHDKELNTASLTIDNVEVLQMTFNQLLHCLGLIQLHGYR